MCFIDYFPKKKIKKKQNIKTITCCRECPYSFGMTIYDCDYCLITNTKYSFSKYCPLLGLIDSHSVSKKKYYFLLDDI